MRAPKRKSELASRQQLHSRDNLVTPTALARFKKDLELLVETERPQTVKDLSQARDMGDLSENAAYSEAKARLSRIDGRIFGLKERIKHAVIIQAPKTDVVGLGSTVTLEVDQVTKTYQILGSQETSPTKGRISYSSPLGSILLKHKVGDQVVLKLKDKTIIYKILKIA